ncbi:MAG: PA0069 family radical SAM protein [Steroidobacteraceae bacterium]|jgi:DNA repair photolyase|nr:PA0069 family radical SAM protein [Steroidobacteraceae bacterium]
MRGALSNPEGRFESTRFTAEDDGWGILEEPLPPLETTVLPERARSVITRNDSPDVPFDQSINPYRGCEHGCVYCFARPAHAYVNLSPGLDFETKLFYKQDAAARLGEELAKPGYRCRPIALGTNTDPYQPVERRHRVTRSLLEAMLECGHPVSIVTKSTLVLRDLDLLTALAARNLTRVFISVTTLADELKRRMEPRAASPAARLAAVRRLADAGVPVGVMYAPVIPALNDHELEAIVEAAARAGARSAAYVLLRLPREVRDLFYEWLAAHYPDRAARVRARLREMRGGQDNDPRFGGRMRGQGPWAALLAARFSVALRRNGLADRELVSLDTSQFRPPRPASPQLPLL